jgi:clan AA aspartic protease
MISGVVTPQREAIVHLAVRDRAGNERDVEAIIDTGFDGSLTLPPSVIAALGLTWRRRGRALLADGSDSICDIFEATVVWDAVPRRISVDAADIKPLIGMSLLDGYELNMRVADGGDVRITALR